MSAVLAAPAREDRPTRGRGVTPTSGDSECGDSRERGGPGSQNSPLDASAGGRLTLEQRLECVWEGLRTANAECPVCHSELISGATGPDVRARCARCGSTIS